MDRPPVIRIRLLAVAILLGVLVLMSYWSTSGYVFWDGGFPAAQFRITVVDPDGGPIPGAALRAYPHGRPQPAGDYPIHENPDPAKLTAGADGLIVCHQPRMGLQFGGQYTHWRLLWLIPIRTGDTGAPQFDFVFTAPGFQTRTLSTADFFDGWQCDSHATSTFADGPFTSELPIARRRITLQPQ